jgi:dihydrofolate reductase
LLRAFPAFDIVVAADQAWGVGHGNTLPWPRLKGDRAHLKALTVDAPDGKRNAVIMGRRTWESKEVGGKPLPRRLTIVVSRGTSALPEGVLAARSLTEALYRAGRHDDIDNVFVLGGAQLYRDALEHPRLRVPHAHRTAVRVRRAHPEPRAPRA